MGHAKQKGFANAVTVRIWYPNTDKSTFLDKALSPIGMGHASLTVKLNSVRHYITWQVANGIPTLTEEHTALNYMTGNAYRPEGQMHKAKDESWMSNMKWGQMNGDARAPFEGWRQRSESDWKMRIKTLQPDEIGTGLNAQAIIDWWENRVASENVYKLISTNQNCTGCVAEALKAGGLLGSPSGWFLVGASDLRTWVESQVIQQNLQLDQAKAGFE